MRRSSKFYNQNEKEVMRRFGLVPTKASGAGWIEKEDGYNEVMMAQLKSTDADSIRISLHDIHTLEYNALVAHKVPVFMVQFLKSNELFLLIRPTDLPTTAEYLHTGRYDLIIPEVNIECEEEEGEWECKVIKSNPKAKSKYWEDKNKEWIECRKLRK